MIEGEQPPVSLGVLPDTPLARVPLPRELAARLGPGQHARGQRRAAGGSTTGVPRPGGGGGRDQRRVTADQSAEAGGEAVGEAAEQRRVEPGPGRQRRAERVEDAGADLGALDDGRRAASARTAAR